MSITWTVSPVSSAVIGKFSYFVPIDLYLAHQLCRCISMAFTVVTRHCAPMSYNSNEQRGVRAHAKVTKMRMGVKRRNGARAGGTVYV